MIDIFDQLRDLYLTDNGKELLTTIPRNTLFKAKRDFDKIERYIPCYKINTLYAISLRFCEMQKCYPDWKLAANFDINQTISRSGEKFNMRLSLKIEEHLESKTKDLIGLKHKLFELEPDGSIQTPLKELRKALTTGRVNIKGLKFLKGCFAKNKPELLLEINKYICKIEKDMIQNIKDEMNNEIEINENISCIEVESVL